MDDLDDLLARRDRLGDGLAGGLDLDGLDEIAGDGQRDVGFQQRGANLAQGGIDIGLGQRALLGQTVKDAAQAI